MHEPQEVQKRIELIEGLVREIECVADPAVRSLSKQLAQSLMDLHAAGIERMLELTHESREAGQKLIDDFGRDDVVKGLLLLYGLHPLDLQSRVLEALEKARPHVAPQGGILELLDVDGLGAVRLRLQRSGHTCPSSLTSMRDTISQFIYEAAPEVTSIVMDDGETGSAMAAGFVPLSALQGKLEICADGAQVSQDVR